MYEEQDKLDKELQDKLSNDQKDLIKKLRGYFKEYRQVQDSEEDETRKLEHRKELKHKYDLINKQLHEEIWKKQIENHDWMRQRVREFDQAFLDEQKQEDDDDENDEEDYYS